MTGSDRVGLFECFAEGAGAFRAGVFSVDTGSGFGGVTCVSPDLLGTVRISEDCIIGLLLDTGVRPTGDRVTVADLSGGATILDPDPHVGAE